jgi:Right handed beta helix region
MKFMLKPLVLLCAGAFAYAQTVIAPGSEPPNIFDAAIHKEAISFFPALKDGIAPTYLEGSAGAVGPVSGTVVSGASSLVLADAVQTAPFNSGNNELNPTLFSGSDIGAQINSAVSSCPFAENCTIAIPPGTYHQATQIKITGTKIHLVGSGATLVANSGIAMVSICGGSKNSIEGITFNLNGAVTYGVVINGNAADVTIKRNTFIGSGAYAIYASYAGEGLAILDNSFASDSSGHGPGPMTIQFTSHFRVERNHFRNTLGFGIPTIASNHGIIDGNDFYQPAFRQTIVAGSGQTTFAFTLPSYVTRVGANVNGVPTALAKLSHTAGNTWIATFSASPKIGSVVTFLGWQALENIQVNSQSFDISITGNAMDGTGDSGIDVVSDYHATTLATATAANNQMVFKFTGKVSFFAGVEIGGRVLSGSDVLNGGPVNTSGDNWTVTLAHPQPSGTLVSFVNLSIMANGPADLPGQVVISGNSVRRAAATGIGLESGAPNIIVNSNVIEDCGQTSSDPSFSSGIFAANSSNVSIRNNTIRNTLPVPSMRFGISMNYTTQDNGSIDKLIKVGGNVFYGVFQHQIFIPSQSPTQRQTGIDVDGTTIPYPEQININDAWSVLPNNTNYFTYVSNNISLIRDTINVMNGVASIRYPGDRGNSAFYVQINPTAVSLFGSNSILKVSWWAQLTSGVWGVQLWTHAGGIGGQFSAQEIDVSAAGWRQYSIYISTLGLDLSNGVFIRLVGSGTGNIQNITFASTPMDNNRNSPP